MRKISFLASVAILCASVVWAQDPSPQPATQDPNAQSPSSNQSATPSSNGPSTTSTGIQGCLSGSDGNYILTQDGTGTAYRLSGGDSQLKDHVGHEVQISGQLVNSGAPDQAQTGTTTGNAAASTNILQVSDVTMVSEKCLTGAGTSGSPSASNAEAAAATSTPETASTGAASTNATTPTDSNANSGQSTPDNGSTTTTAAAQPSYASPSSTQETAQNTPPARSGDSDAPMGSNNAVSRNSDSMPKTASDLPEIGLLGLSLLAAGIASKRRNNLLG